VPASTPSRVPEIRELRPTDVRRTGTVYDCESDRKKVAGVDRLKTDATAAQRPAAAAAAGCCCCIASSMTFICAQSESPGVVYSSRGNRDNCATPRRFCCCYRSSKLYWDFARYNFTSHPDGIIVDSGIATSGQGWAPCLPTRAHPTSATVGLWICGDSKSFLGST